MQSLLGGGRDSPHSNEKMGLHAEGFTRRVSEWLPASEKTAQEEEGAAREIFPPLGRQKMAW